MNKDRTTYLRALADDLSGIAAALRTIAEDEHLNEELRAIADDMRRSGETTDTTVDDYDQATISASFSAAAKHSRFFGFNEDGKAS